MSNYGAYTINVDFIEALQGRCPKFSRRDHEILQKSLETDGVLGHFSPSARDHIYQTAVGYTRTIPSLFTLFQDCKYIQICWEVLNGLLASGDRLPHQSLEQCFERLFSRPEHLVIQTEHQIFRQCSVVDPRECFRLGYSQLWLLAMRLWPFLLVRRGRKHRNSVEEQFNTAHRKSFWSLIAQSAQKLGFDSPHLQSLSARDLPRGLSNSPRYAGFTGPIDGTVWERYGTPFDDKYLLDRNSLFLPRLLGSSGLRGINLGEDITTLLVRRSLFVRIFPELNLPVQNTGGNSDVRQSTSPSRVQSAPLASDRHSFVPEPSTNEQGHFAAQQSASPRSVTITPHGIGPSSQQTYYVDVWQGGSTLVAKTIGSREDWTKDLRSFTVHHFSLWDPDTLVIVDPEVLEFYQKRRILAIPPTLNITQLRQLRGMAID